MREWAPQEVDYYKRRYAAAGKGNYDIYVVFVEKGLSLLNPHGRLGFILPHKFFTAQYGEPLRRLISEGRHLAEVVHFGDQQVFAQATTYTCLMFLSKASRDTADVLTVRDLAAWRKSSGMTMGRLPLDRISAREWHLVGGDDGALLDRLGQMPSNLGSVAARILQGLVTGADPVFLLTDTPSGLYHSDATGLDHQLEADLLHPLCKGSVNMRRYRIADVTKSILFPYRLVNGKAELLTPAELARLYPEVWRYLLANRGRLESRENGKWKHQRWYAFGRSQNLSQMEQPKIMTPSIASRASFSLDRSGHYYFVGSGGGGGGGYGITLRSGAGLAYEYVLGLLNSRLLDFYLRRASTPFRGGYYAYNRQYIEGLPIRTIDFADPADVARHDRLVALVERMLALHEELAAARASAPARVVLLERQIAATDAEIDRLVYDLYGLTEEEIRLVEGEGQ